MHEIFEDEDSLYIVTEYLDGGELFDEISRRIKFSESLASDVMKQILRGILYCNKKKIMHRDLKPENILIDTLTAKTLTVKIIDFGFGHRFFTNDDFQPRAGTAYYMAPEVIMKSYNETCDIWSCGVILYIMASGKQPFYGATQDDVLREVKNALIKFTDEVWENITSELKDLIRRMIRYPPTARISATEAYSHVWMQIPSLTEPNTTVIQNILYKLENYIKVMLCKYIAKIYITKNGVNVYGYTIIT